MTSSPVYPWEAPLGAVPLPGGEMTRFRVWAPRARELALEAGGVEHPLEPEGYGVHVAELPVPAGRDYAYRVDGVLLPDPCTRWQPDGLRGPSRVLDPASFTWTDDDFAPVPLAETVLYELHVGTFTPEGTFRAAIPHLRGLVELGVTAVELMPLAEFPGRHGWGYDGVYLNAPHSAYGTPHDLAALVDAAHTAGLSVILDVVHNHLGASGVKAMEAFGPYLTDKYATPWGKAVNLDDAGADPVREWILQSAEAWIRDFHLDGLRLDAIHALMDSSAEHLVAALTRRVHAVKPEALVVAESGMNDPKVVRGPREGGWGCDAVWADDFHHALRVALTGETDGWYEEFSDLGTLAKAMHRPHVHDGTYSSFRGRRFGAPAFDRPPEEFVVFAQNHDQVGNRAFGDRLPEAARPLAAFCTLLSPFTPMLFMGEEHGEEAPFQFFSDHIDEKIATATREGRRREFAAFAAFAGEEVPDPQDAATFERSKLTRRGDDALRALYAELLRVRRELPRGDVNEVAHDEDARWLRVVRGPYRLVCNFAPEEADVPAPGAGEVVLSTHDARIEGDAVRLPALAAALMR
jgi:maltooligosyltrehalose trehalohydrolase